MSLLQRHAFVLFNSDKVIFVYMISLFLPALVFFKSMYPPINVGKRHRETPPFHKLSLQGTYTIEAAVVMPVFTCLLVTVLLFFRILTVQWGIGMALHEVAQEAALSSSYTGEETVNAGAGTSAAVVGATTAYMVKHGVPFRYIRGGLAGLNYAGTQVNEQDICIQVQYDIPLPIGMFGRKAWHLSQSVRARRWVGYNPHEEEQDDVGVYVTEYGTAYHAKYDCVYLNPSVRSVNAGQIRDSRNESGGRYQPCRRCHPALSGILYITDYGNVYHASVTCSSLKRSTQRIALELARERGYHSCIKCAD